jgi:hypothetical protein
MDYEKNDIIGVVILAILLIIIGAAIKSEELIFAGIGVLLLIGIDKYMKG